MGLVHALIHLFIHPFKTHAPNPEDEKKIQAVPVRRSQIDRPLAGDG